MMVDKRRRETTCAVGSGSGFSRSSCRQVQEPLGLRTYSASLEWMIATLAADFHKVLQCL